MKVACIFITCNRFNLTEQCIKQNFFNAGKDADVFLIDNGSDIETFDKVCESYPFKGHYRFQTNEGISHAINAGIRLAKDYDAIVTLANDILMPKGWLLKMTEAAEKIPNTGMVGIHCVESLPSEKEINGLTVHPTFAPFGNVLITMKAIEAVGMWNEDYDPYGMNDSDYGYRVDKSGFTNYYLHGLRSEHIGHDVGSASEYRRVKDAGLAKAMKVWGEALERYEKEGYKIEY